MKARVIFVDKNGKITQTIIKIGTTRSDLERRLIEIGIAESICGLTMITNDYEAEIRPTDKQGETAFIKYINQL